MEEHPKKGETVGETPNVQHQKPDSLDIAMAPEPAADEAVKAALNVAESVGRSEGGAETGLGLGFGDLPDSVSLNQILDQAEQRSKALFEKATSEVQEPLEELDVLDIAAQFGRPSESVATMDDTSADATNGFDDTKDLMPNPVARKEWEYSPTPAIAAPIVPAPETPSREAASGKTDDEPRAAGATDPTDGLFAKPASPHPRPEKPRIVSIRKREDTPSADTLSLDPAEKTENDEKIRRLVAQKVSAVNEGTYFEILEVPSTASDAEVRDAYRHLLHKFREERFKDSALSDMRRDVRLIRVVVDEAFEVLRGPQMRERYRRASSEDSG